MNSADETKVKTMYDKLIFEVACLGCGKTVFNLPYVKDSYHTVTCRECGEVTIANVLDNGGLAVATQNQRNYALDEYRKNLGTNIKSIYKDYIDWVSTDLSLIGRHKDHLDIIVEILIKGIIANCKYYYLGLETSNTLDAFNNYLLVSNKITPE